MSDMSKNAGKAAGKAARGAKRFAVSAARATQRVSRIARLRLDIASEKETIRRLYSEIGRLYYEAHRDDPEGFFVHLFQTIDASMDSIEEKKAEIAVLRAETKPAHPAPDPDASEDEKDVTVEITVEPDDPETPGAEAETEADPG